MKGLAFAFILLFALLFAPKAGATEIESEAYRVGVRDELTIEVFGHEDLTRAVVVAEDGTISFPLLESVSVKGLTTQEIANHMRDRLGVNYLVNPHVECKVAVYRSQPVEVMGAVTKSGIYYLEGPTHLSAVLLDAGWVDSEKSNGQVLISRGGQTIVVMLEQLNQNKDNLLLEANDVVTLPEGQFVFVSGEVIKPGQFLYTNGL
ncbi:MAG: polysaccharide export protein, partial [Proteobacteria bacterium]|nr:polysaccharide export protein [Pseudomonadota bacterium]